jgi:hypothetical protein
MCQAEPLYPPGHPPFHPRGLAGERVIVSAIQQIA